MRSFPNATERRNSGPEGTNLEPRRYGIPTAATFSAHLIVALSVIGEVP
jgi:hypothetical protein